MNKYIFFLLIATVLLIFQPTQLSASENPQKSQNTEVTQSTEHNIFDTPPSPYMVIPFIVLLLMISTGPLFYKHFWEHNYPKISITLGSITVLYYIFIFQDTASLIHTLEEYISFIALLTSLFVASGGILIKIDRKSTPFANVLLLLFGAVISNLIGTTGASMLLIRPYIRMNRNRIKPYHIIFFIFVVSNIGGGLTPIGDPPLFLGFLKGIEFFWVIKHVWHIWLLTIFLVLSVFFLLDYFNYKKSVSGVDKEYSGKIELKGKKNFIYLLIIIISVFIDPAVMSWVPSLHPLPFGIREIIMFTVAFVSYKRADKEALKGNEFNFDPIKEVAYLFVGIFATMIPALQLVAYETHKYGEKLTADIFYWGTGLLSSILDNAPTYLNFLSAAMGKFGLNIDNYQHVKIFETHDPIYLMAISVAAVYFGAMTYIGNGPNFMVKSISESSGIKLPSFFGYVAKYSIPVLLPIFTLIWYLFFFGRG
ncbi:MAG: sodium:proton antiporter [Ignavibacteria bacterium]|nr:sodium:proton antiporter [Ignavibacteria bacterium]